MKNRKPIFESEVCGRCGGSGSHSFNQMHGSVCYGCGGTGYRLTRRGQAAQNFFNKFREIKASDVKVGDLVLTHGMEGSGYSAVETIDIGPAKLQGVYQVGMEDAIQIKITTRLSGLFCEPHHIMQRGFTAEEKKEKFALSLAYQATLGKHGKPLKIKVK